ncbi:hypothetical protein [Mesorhizobium helmanticense]|uniref:hypothetical protein n=1 Tax=Mesorhizobium helmanticense TaxID=1776423 RepID=UPI00142DC7DF|nr:hypothetical protein [Mesorhizobium helmanticense]
MDRNRWPQELPCELTLKAQKCEVDCHENVVEQHRNKHRDSAGTSPRNPATKAQRQQCDPCHPRHDHGYCREFDAKEQPGDDAGDNDKGDTGNALYRRFNAQQHGR